MTQYVSSQHTKKKKEGKKNYLTAVTTGQKKVETNNKIHDAIKQIHSWGVGLRVTS